MKLFSTLVIVLVSAHFAQTPDASALCLTGFSQPANDRNTAMVASLVSQQTVTDHCKQPSAPGKAKRTFVPVYQANNELVEIFILYPYNSERLNLHLFFNKKLVRKLQNGERLAYNIASEGMLKLTVLTTESYTEPATLGRNTRSIALKRGKAYYFEITGSGVINYIVNTDKAKEKYNDVKNFAGQPTVIAGTLTDSLLSTKN